MSLDLSANPEYNKFKENLAKLVSTLDDPQYKEFEEQADKLTLAEFNYMFYHKVSQQVFKAATLDPYENTLLLYSLDFFIMYLREKYEGLQKSGE